jgi:hypothetical protein
MRPLFASILVLALGLACAGPVSSPVAVGGGGGYGDVTYKRYKNMDQVEILEFSSAEKVQIFYSGRFDQRKTRVGTWTQDGPEIELTLEPLKDYADPHSVGIKMKQLGRCSIALYHRDKTDGSTWSSGDVMEDEQLAQPVLFEQKWPPCEAH